MDQIWNRITRNRAIGRHTWLYIDEMQLLFSNEFSANYIFLSSGAGAGSGEQSRLELLKMWKPFCSLTLHAGC